MEFVKSLWSADGKREARVIAQIVTPPPIVSFRILYFTEEEVVKISNYHPIHNLERIMSDAENFVK